MTLEEAYRLKGECVTQIEIWNSKLQAANKIIVSLLNEKTEDK